VLSAFFSVSLAASTGPFCIRGVEEIDRFRPTAREGVVVRTELRAAKRAAMGEMRMIDEDILIVCVLCISRKFKLNQLKSIDRCLSIPKRLGNERI
jgi:hypothetical protein